MNEMRTAIKVCPKIVGIEGRTVEAVIRLQPQAVKCLEGKDTHVGSYGSSSTSSSHMRFEGFLWNRTGNTLRLKYICLLPGRGTVQVDILGETYTIPYVIFKEKELFLSLIITSNYHVGFDPENYIWGSKELEKDVEGHAFLKTCRTLEPIYHARELPITWLIDPVVAEVAKEKINEWHTRYGDDYGVMPSSYFFHNQVNYNTEKSAEEAKALLKASLEQVEAQFDFYTEIAGIDQWVGSVGGHFVQACEKLGMKGIWGMGFDHFTCDTSMYHRGCPWDAYKPDAQNFRIPARYSSDLWAYQWTTRDIINTAHTPTGNSGSVMFSTDPDDIRANDIIQYQKDYYTKLFGEYKKNMAQNDCLIFHLHQEDHDTHYLECNAYLEAFIEDVKEDATFATLQEISSWLNLKYGKEEPFCQNLYLEDVLTVRDEIKWGYGHVEKPDDWPQAGKTYAPHAAYYDRDRQVIFQRPQNEPWRLFQYDPAHPCKEDEVYPEEDISGIRVLQVQYNGEDNDCKCCITIESTKTCKAYPVILWDYPQALRQRLATDKESIVVTNEYVIVLCDIQEGTQVLNK